jgi:hypothetical protein
MGKKAKKVKKANVTPTYMKGKKLLKIGLHDVMRALKVIDDNGLTKKFARKAKEKGASMSVNADTVNFVKDFMVDNDLHGHPIGKHIVNAAGLKRAASVGMAAARRPQRDRFDCNFGSG